MGKEMYETMPAWPLTVGALDKFPAAKPGRGERQHWPTSGARPEEERKKEKKEDERKSKQPDDLLRIRLCPLLASRGSPALCFAQGPGFALYPLALVPPQGHWLRDGPSRDRRRSVFGNLAPFLEVTVYKPHNSGYTIQILHPFRVSGSLLKKGALEMASFRLRMKG